MPKITIDNQAVEVHDGATILEAAKKLGIRIPTLCFLPGHKACTSCFVCVVKLAGRDNLVPSCATRAEDGMAVLSEIPEVLDARRTALELLLSDHLGDCEGPCHRVCPSHMNIPKMIRQIHAGDLAGAIATVKADIALPATLGRICHAPCERPCRRNAVDQAVSIMRLKQYVADHDLAQAQPFLPYCRKSSGKKVAVVGAGPAGLSAAYHLLQDGYACVIFDQHDRPGGMLRFGIEEHRLPSQILDAEIDVIRKLGAEFRMNVRVGESVSLEQLRKDFDAVVIATGKRRENAPELAAFKTGKDGIEVNPHTLATSEIGVFAGGDVVRAQKMTIRSVADGKAMAASISQYLAGQHVTGQRKTFNIHIGHLREVEIPRFMDGVNRDARREGAGGIFSDDQARLEAARCMHCDCRKAVGCRLRHWSEHFQAKPFRYSSNRRIFEQHAENPLVIYEPGKCIDCGLCVQIAADAGEKIGLSFVGRGFSVRMAVPFGDGMDAALKTVAQQCARACPTGALVLRKATT